MGSVRFSITQSCATLQKLAIFYKMLGQPDTITDAKGTDTSYTLDSFGRVTNMALENLAAIGYTYNNGMLSALQRTVGSATQSYTFAYDAFGNTTSISVGSGADAIALAAYNYGANNGLLTSQTYGNSDSVSFTYDNLGRVKTTTYSDGRVLTYRYTGDGQLYCVQDSKTGLTYQYSYDSLGRLMSSSVKNSSGNVLTTRQTYDANNQMTAQSWQMGSDTYSETYTYSLTTGLLATHTPAVGSKRTYAYDVLQRLSTITGGIYGKTYTYRDVSDTHTTTQVAGLTYDLATDITYGYTYDVLGNIATYTQGGTTYTYTYDAQNQLLQQTGGGKTYTYTYDAAGNILTASDGTTSHSYTYGHAAWKDLLTAVDGQSISYDGAGNPTSYYNGTRWTFGWEEGRRLVSATNGTTNLSFTYDSEGLRLSKTVGSTEHNYYYAGGKLLRETYGSNTLDFFYDAQGTPYAVKYNGTLYYYITNLQGDILHIVDATGATVVSYTYSPYGKPLSTTGSLASTLGAANPLRYRGYYYDSELGLYYLQSRYYDPELCRFINADSYASTGQGIIGFNMFAYCNNSVITFYDSEGDRLVGVGFQFDIQGGEGSVGVEVVIYFDQTVCDGENFKVVFYQYSGVEISASRLTSYIDFIDAQLIAETFENGNFTQDAMLTILRGIMEGAGVSGAAFVIDGNHNFDDVEDYAGAFETLSIAISLDPATVTGFHSYSPTCTATGIKVGVSTPRISKWAWPIDLSYSRTEYTIIDHWW